MNKPVETRVLQNLRKYDPIVNRLGRKHPEFSSTINLVKLAVKGLATYYGLFILDQHGKLIRTARIEDDYSRNVTLIGRELRTWAKNPDLTLKGKMVLDQLYLVLGRCLRDALELYAESERQLMLEGVKIYMSAGDGYGEYERAKAALWTFQNEFHLHQIDVRRGNERAIIYAQPGYSGPPADFNNLDFFMPRWQEPDDESIQHLTQEEQMQLKSFLTRPEVQKLLPRDLRNPNISLPPSEEDERHTPGPIRNIAPLGRPRRQFLQRKGILKNPMVETPRENTPKKRVRFGPYREPPLPSERVQDDAPPDGYVDNTTQRPSTPATIICGLPPDSPQSRSSRRAFPASHDGPRPPRGSPPIPVSSSREDLFGFVALVDQANIDDTPSPTTSSSSSSTSSQPPVVPVVDPPLVYTTGTPGSTTSSTSSSSSEKEPAVDVTPASPIPSTSSSSSSSSSSKTPAQVIPDIPSPSTSSSSSSSSSAVQSVQPPAIVVTHPTPTATEASSSSSSSTQSDVVMEDANVIDPPASPASVVSISSSSSSSLPSVGPRSPDEPTSVTQDEDGHVTASNSSEDEDLTEQSRFRGLRNKEEELRREVAEAVCTYRGRRHPEYSQALATEDEDPNAVHFVPYNDEAYTAHHKMSRTTSRMAARNVRRTAVLHWAGVTKAKREERIEGHERLRAILKWAEREGKVPLSPSSIRASTGLRRSIFAPLGLLTMPPPRGGSPGTYREATLARLEQLRPRLDLTLLAFLFNEDALRLFGGLVGEQPRPRDLARMDRVLRELEVYIAVCGHRQRLIVRHLKHRRDFPLAIAAQSGDLRAALRDAEEDVLFASRRCFEYVAARSRYVMTYPGNKRQRREFAGRFGPRDRERLEYLAGLDDEAGALREELEAGEEWHAWCVGMVARWTFGWRPARVERDMLYVDEDVEADVRRYKREINQKRVALGLVPVKRPQDEIYERQKEYIMQFDELWSIMA